MAKGAGRLRNGTMSVGPSACLSVLSIAAKLHYGVQISIDKQQRRNYQYLPERSSERAASYAVIRGTKINKDLLSQSGRCEAMRARDK